MLEAILGKRINIKKVIHDARLEQLAKEQKYGILDLDVELEDGEIINIELDKFRNENPDMKDQLNQWLAFLDMERGELLEMAKKENKKIEKAVKNYEVLTGDAEVKRLAEIRLMSELEEKSALACEREIGKELRNERGKRVAE